MNCPKCNFENENDAKYCIGCGTPLFKECDNCGKLAHWKANFCVECGNKFPFFDLKIEIYKRKMHFYDEIMIGKSKGGKFVVAKDKNKYMILNINQGISIKNNSQRVLKF